MSEPFEGWAVLELMGHRRIAGKLTEQTGGCFAGLLRIDIPGPDGAIAATQFYSSAAVYCITPTTEEIARHVAVRNVPEPVHAWELPKKLPAAPPEGEPADLVHPSEFDDDDEEDDEDEEDNPDELHAFQGDDAGPCEVCGKTLVADVHVVDGPIAEEG